MAFHSRVNMSVFCAAALATVVLLVTTVQAYQEPATAPQTSSAQDHIVAQQSAVAQEIARLQSAIEASGTDSTALQAEELDVLKRLELLLKQQLAVVQQNAEAAVTQSQLDHDLETIQTTGLAEQPPYSLLMLDAVRDELRTLLGRIETTEAGMAAAVTAREQARTTLDQRDTARRQAREALESNSDESKAGPLARQLRLSELEVRVATEALQLRRVEEERQRLLSQSYASRVALAEEREKRIAADSTFLADDLRAKIVEIEAKEEQIRRKLDLQQRRIEFSEREWIDATHRLESNTADAPALIEEVAARRLAFQVQQREVATLAKRIERLNETKEMWRRRFEVWRGNQDRATLSTWDADARAMLDSLDTEFRLQELELRDLAKDRLALQSRLENASGDTDPLTPWLRMQIELSGHLNDVLEENVASIDSTRRLAERLLTDIDREQASISWGERAASVWRSATAVWNFELTSIDDRSISVGKVVIGVTLLLLGFFLSKIISSWLARRVLPRLGMNEGAAAAIRSVLFYLLLIGFVFFALRTINVPLTAFTILGGAVAIGVGFGSQNIMNNFMSGLILIAERPVRVGDLIQLGDLYGVVQHLGARSTRVLTGDNMEIVVPNSSFLENNVINWTLSESRVRIHVSVGVVYGSPTREVTRLLRKAVEEHGRVLKSPAPIVLFTAFADNSLNFEVHFWISMRKIMDRRMIESDIRYRIDNLFNEAKLVIAFPQRDVHLDTVRPIEVRMVSEDADATGAETARTEATDEKSDEI